MRLPLFIAGLFIVVSISAQSHKADSLRRLLKTKIPDSTRSKALSSLGKQLFIAGNFDTAIICTESALDLAQKCRFVFGQATAHNVMGMAFYTQGKYPAALKAFLTSLALSEQIQNKKGMADANSNAAQVFYMQRDFEEALKYNLRALGIRKATGDKLGMANSYNNLGNIYNERNDFERALQNQKLGLELRRSINDKQGIATSLLNIGNIYYSINRRNESLSNYMEALGIFEEMGDAYGVVATYVPIGTVYLIEHKTNKAREWFHKCEKLSLEIGALDYAKESYQYLAAADSVDGNYKSSLENYKKCILFRDSLLNEENTKKTIQAQMQYEFEKKESATRLEQEKKEAVAAAERKRQRIILLSVSCFGALILLFALFAYRSFLQKKKANHEITEQKQLIEEKQKEILDSIYYARRIQRSLLATEKYIHRKLTMLQTGTIE